jgi:hypothetical protein
MEITSQLEAQFWWAFACLTLAGRRSAEQFDEETSRRLGGSFASESEVNSIMDEAFQHLADVLNSSLASKEQRMRPAEAAKSANLPNYDIFRNCENGDSIWIETVPGLEEAKRRVISLAVASPGKYVLFNAKEGGFVEPFSASTNGDWVS